MYVEFYNLAALPFRLVPDHRFFFGSREHRKALAYLKFGLQQGEGFIVVTGDVGAGKSTLVSRVLAELDGVPLTAALITTTQVGAKDAILLILAAFNIKPIPSDKGGMLRSFDTFLREQHAAGRRVLLVIDEAQGLPPRTLEELRMLSNLIVDERAAFQCFMLGQPQLMEILSRPNLEQFRQRVVASCHLGPLQESETREYIEHRLICAGWSGDPAFTDGAFRRIHDATDGIPRRINMLCGRLLFFGALEQLRELGEAAVDEVLEDLKREALDPVHPAPALGSRRSAPGRRGVWTPGADRTGDSSLSPRSASQTLAADLPPRIADFLERLDRQLDAQNELMTRVLDAVEMRSRDTLLDARVEQQSKPTTRPRAPSGIAVPGPEPPTGTAAQRDDGEGTWNTNGVDEAAPQVTRANGHGVQEAIALPRAPATVGVASDVVKVSADVLATTDRAESTSRRRTGWPAFLRRAP
jgi:general secretion pathway protein A